MKCLAAAALFVVAGPAWAQARFEWDIPGAVERVAVASTLEADGIPVRLEAVKSNWPAPELARHLVKSFRQAHLYVPPPTDQLELTRELQLTALDPTRLVAYSVFLQPNPDGTTTCILGEAAPAARRRTGVEEIGPLFPGARSPVRSDVEGLKTLAYSAQATPSAIVAFYREALAKQGYREIQEGEFVRSGRSLRVAVKADGPNSVSVALIAKRTSN